MNTRRFQFRIVDLMLVTVVVALILAAAKENPIHGTAHSDILLLVLAGILGAVTGRLVSDSFRFGTVGGLLLGALGYLLAVFALSLGIKIADTTLFLICVCAGGIIGGLIPTMLHRLRQASFRSHMSILLVGVGLLVILIIRWRTVNEQTRTVAELRAVGAYVQYSDVNPLPMILDSRQKETRSEWLLKLLGLRVIRSVTLIDKLSLHADHMDETFVLLNSEILSRLESLRFIGRGFDDTSLSRLHPLPSLVLLDLAGTSVTDESVEHIATFSRLMVLDIRDTEITADGVKRLKSKIGRVLSRR